MLAATGGYHSGLRGERRTWVACAPGRCSRRYDGSLDRCPGSFGRLWLAKTLADFEINNIAAALPPGVLLQLLAMFRIHRPVPRNAGSFLARSSKSPTGESRTTSTTRRTEASASAAKVRPPRQALLGRRPSILVRMATIPHCGHARNRRALAQGRIPFVLEADLQGQEARWETTDVEGD